jgi:hypothetical protein
MSENYFIDKGRGLEPAAPARIVCYPEGDGEWTIEAQDADGRAIRDERGDYLSVWHDEEALDDFRPMSRDGAVEEASRLAADMRRPMLPIYMDEDDGLPPVAGGAADAAASIVSE